MKSIKNFDDYEDEQDVDFDEDDCISYGDYDDFEEEDYEEEDYEEEEEKRVVVVKPKQLPKVLPPAPPAPEKIDVKLPLGWLDKKPTTVQFDGDEKEYPELLSEDEGWTRVVKKSMKKKSNSPSFRHVKFTRDVPNIRCVINMRPKYELNHVERKNFGYGPYTMNMLPSKKEQSRVMCAKVVQNGECGDEKCVFEHDFKQWCKTDKTKQYCRRLCTFAHFHVKKEKQQKFGVKMCNKILAGKPCLELFCEYEHDVKRWCPTDRKNQRCAVRACRLCHHNLQKIPNFLIFCTNGDKCRDKNCRFPHNRLERFNYAEDCMAEYNCTKKGCVRRHPQDTVISFNTRLAA